MLSIFILSLGLLLIFFILLQQKSAGLGSMAGSDGGDEIEKTRRGADKMLHNLTIGCATLFLGLCIYSMFLGIS